jgi:hypothetical protein
VRTPRYFGLLAEVDIRSVVDVDTLLAVLSSDRESGQ